VRPARRKSERGFILVNALLIVAALTAAAVLLLSRAEAGRNRLERAREVAQVGLYLDGFEALVLSILDRDRLAGASDHPGEDWARATYDIAVDRGRVAGQIADLQGRFNINWLTSPDIPEARPGFARLAATIGLPPARIAAIQTYVSRARDGAEGGLAAYARLPVPIHPRGRPVSMIEELRQVAGLREDEFIRLRRLVTALPPETPLNINTATPEVLASLLPEGAERTARSVVFARQNAPFATLEDFLVFLDATSDIDTELLNPLLFSVESNWFLVETAASLGATARRRNTVVQRQGPTRRARVIYRLRMQE